VRELENLIERIIALTDGTVITCDDLPAGFVRVKRSSVGVRIDLNEKGVDLVATLGEIERNLIAQALKLSGGNKAKASALLGINRTTLVEKLKRLKVES
jgi:DNA-binding NtrC family response regulator